jgi:hypothetical protein
MSYRVRTICQACGAITVHEARPASFEHHVVCSCGAVFWPARYVCYECGRPLFLDEATQRGLPRLTERGEPMLRIDHART